MNKPGKSWLRTAGLVALVATGLSLTAVHSAQAAESATGQIGSLQPIKTAVATTEQIRAMAATGTGELLTLPADPAKSAGIAHDVTCYLFVFNPYGGGAPDADILVDGAVYCDDWVHSAALQVQLYRGGSLVASNSATYPYVYGLGVTAGVTTCTAGTYFGVATTVLARYDHYPPVITGTRRSLDVGIGCGSAPPPPPPPTGVSVANPGNQTTYRYDFADLQLSASGGTPPYTWSAAGLPAGFGIDSSTGRITGSTNIIASYTVTVTATDTGGRSGSATFTWRIIREACPTC